MVDQIDNATGRAVRTTNPFEQRVDMLWYEVPVIYELNRQQLYYITTTRQQASGRTSEAKLFGNGSEL